MHRCLSVRGSGYHVIGSVQFTHQCHRNATRPSNFKIYAHSQNLEHVEV